MAINFPGSPQTNDLHTIGSFTYKYDGDKWIGVGLTPTDRLIEGSNKLEINASNQLVWSGGDVGIGTDSPLQTTGGRTVLNINGTNNALLNFSYGATLSGFLYGANDEFRMEAAGTNPLVFRTAGGTALTIDTNAKLILPTGSPGIQFGSTDSGGSVTSQTLDDYEEGTWTPSGQNNFNTITNATGRYVKVGDIVFLTFQFNFGSLDSASSSSAITGLPYSPANTNPNTGVEATSVCYGNSIQLQIYVQDTPNLSFETNAPLQGTTTTSANFYRGSITYRT